MQGGTIRVEPVLQVLETVTELITEVEDDAQDPMLLRPFEMIDGWRIEVDVAVDYLVYDDTRLRGLAVALRDREEALGFVVGVDAVRVGRGDDGEPYAVELLDALQVQGRLAAAEGPDGATIDISIDGQAAGQPLDLVGAVRMADERWQLRELDLNYGDTSLGATGELDVAGQRLHLRARAGSVHVDQLQRVAEVIMEALGDDEGPPALEPLDLIRDWAVDIGVAVDRLVYQDSQVHALVVEASDRARGVDFSMRLNHLHAGNGEAEPWQLVEPLRLQGSLITAGGPEERALGAEIRVATRDIDAELVLLPDAEPEPRFSLQVSADSAAALEGPWVDMLIPIEVDIQARRDDAAWRVQPLHLAVAGSQLNGRLVIDPTAAPVSVRGDLHAPVIDLGRVLAIGGDNGIGDEGINGLVPDERDHESDERERDDDDASPEVNGMLIPEEPMDWSWLASAAVDVRARIERLAFEHTTVRNLRAQVQMQDGALGLDLVDSDLTQGRLRGHVRAQQRNGGAGLSVQLIATALTPADFGQFDDDVLEGGATDLFIDLRAEGASPRELASTLNGEVVFEIQNAVISEDFFRMFESDILMTTIGLVNPIILRDDRTVLECAAAYLLAADGVLSSPDLMVFETDYLEIRAGGSIDLHDESMEIEFAPNEREGVLDVDLGDVARLVRVSGTLAAPEVEPDPQGIAEAVLTVGAGIATGGLSLLAQEIFDRVRDGATECGDIFQAQLDPGDNDNENDTENDND